MAQPSALVVTYTRKKGLQGEPRNSEQQMEEAGTKKEIIQVVDKVIDEVDRLLEKFEMSAKDVPPPLLTLLEIEQEDSMEAQRGHIELVGTSTKIPSLEEKVEKLLNDL